MGEPSSQSFPWTVEKHTFCFVILSKTLQLFPTPGNPSSHVEVIGILLPDVFLELAFLEICHYL